MCTHTMDFLGALKWVLIFSIVIPTLIIGIVWLTIDFCKFRKRKNESRAGKQNTFYHYGKTSRRLNFPHQLPKGASILKMLPDAQITRSRSPSLLHVNIERRNSVCSCKSDKSDSNKESMVKTPPLIIMINGNEQSDVIDGKFQRKKEEGESSVNSNTSLSSDNLNATDNVLPDHTHDARSNSTNTSNEQFKNDTENRGDNSLNTDLVGSNSNGRIMVHRIGTLDVQKPRERMLSTSSFREDDVFLTPSDRLSLYSDASIITPSCVEFGVDSACFDNESPKSSYLSKLKSKHNGKNFPLHASPEPSFDMESKHPVACDLAKLMEKQDDVDYKTKCQQYVDDEKNSSNYKADNVTYLEKLKNRQNRTIFVTQSEESGDMTKLGNGFEGQHENVDISDDTVEMTEVSQMSYLEKLKDNRDAKIREGPNDDKYGSGGNGVMTEENVSYFEKLKGKIHVKSFEGAEDQREVKLVPDGNECMMEVDKLSYFERLKDRNHVKSVKAPGGQESSGERSYLCKLKAKHNDKPELSLPVNPKHNDNPGLHVPKTNGYMSDECDKITSNFGMEKPTEKVDDYPCNNGYKSDNSDKMSYLERLKEKRDNIMTAVSSIIDNNVDNSPPQTGTQMVSDTKDFRKPTYLETLKSKQSFDVVIDQ